MIATIVVGIVTGICAAWLSLWQARTMRLWEKREEAYLEILNGIQTMYRLNREWLDAYEKGKEVPEDRDRTMRTAWKVEKAKLVRHADLGAFLTSADAEKILAGLSKVLGRTHEHYFDALDEDAAALGNAMEAIKAAAIMDRRQVPLASLTAKKF